MKVTNTGKGSFTLQGSDGYPQSIAPGESMDANEASMASDVMRHWVAVGVLQIGDAPAASPTAAIVEAPAVPAENPVLAAARKARR